MGKLYSEVSELVSRLQGVCDHSKTSSYPYTWSNGHGRHYSMTGTICDFCGWKAPNNDGRFSDPSTWRSQWDDD